LINTFIVTFIKVVFIQSLLFLLACSGEQSKIPLELDKHLFVGEVYPSNNLYIFSFMPTAERPIKWVTTFKYFKMRNNPNPAKIELKEADFYNEYKQIKFDKLEPGLSGFFSAFDQVGDFVQYKVNGRNELHSLIFSLIDYDVQRVIPLQGERTPSKQEVKQAVEILTRWYANYKKAYGFPYSDEKDQIGRPETILNAQRLMAFHIDRTDYSAQISKWNTHSVAYHSSICFVVDVFKKNKYVTNFSSCFANGVL